MLDSAYDGPRRIEDLWGYGYENFQTKESFLQSSPTGKWLNIHWTSGNKQLSTNL